MLRSKSRTRHSRRIVLVVATSLLASTFALGGSAAGSPPDIAEIVITAVTDQGTGVPVAIAGEPFSVAVELRDGSGNPFSVNKDTPISLSAIGGTASLGGTTTGTIPKNGSSTTISGVTYPKVENVTLRASGSRLTPGDWFLTVQKEAVAIPSSANAFTLSTCDPGDPTPSNPICSEVVFHNGVGEDLTGWFGVGNCLDPANCPQDQSVAQVSLYSLIFTTGGIGGLYTKSDPLTVFWKCDGSVCETGTGGPNSGVPFTTLFVETVEGGGFTASPACPAKGTIGENQKFCTDFKQSSRSAGDLILVLLLDGDPRWRR